jgi:intracellular sulfur oxidation DsrE/DsrF family protein
MFAVRRLRLLALIFAAALFGLGSNVNAGDSKIDGATRVVYHLDGGLEQASRALRNIRNHLDADPQAKIVVVAIGPGIDFLLKDARDAGGYPYELIIQQLVERGVQFSVCANTLAARKLSSNNVLSEARVVPSGVAELARLQFREHYAYIKP